MDNDKFPSNLFVLTKTRRRLGLGLGLVVGSIGMIFNVQLFFVGRRCPRLDGSWAVSSSYAIVFSAGNVRSFLFIVTAPLFIHTAGNRQQEQQKQQQHHTTTRYTQQCALAIITIPPLSPRIKWQNNFHGLFHANPTIFAASQLAVGPLNLGLIM